jgi:hypothetical protein
MDLTLREGCWTLFYIKMIPLTGLDNYDSQYYRRQSLWPHDLRHEMSSPTQTLGSWIRIHLSTFPLSLCYPV